MAKAESDHKLEQFIQRLKTEEQQRIAAERKKMSDIGNYTGFIVLVLILLGMVMIFSRVRVRQRTAELLLLLTFYMLFETLLVYSDTLIDTFTGEPIYKIIFNTLLAAILVVVHEYAERQMKFVLFKRRRKKR